MSSEAGTEVEIGAALETGEAVTELATADDAAEDTAREVAVAEADEIEDEDDVGQATRVLSQDEEASSYSSIAQSPPQVSDESPAHGMVQLPEADVRVEGMEFPQ